jgi:hypothetical protein
MSCILISLSGISIKPYTNIAGKCYLSISYGIPFDYPYTATRGYHMEANILKSAFIFFSLATMAGVRLWSIRAAKPKTAEAVK